MNNTKQAVSLGAILHSDFVRDETGMFDCFGIGELREIASFYHDGQFSDLYAFASTGIITEGLAAAAKAAAEVAANVNEVELIGMTDEKIEDLYHESALLTLAKVAGSIFSKE